MIRSEVEESVHNAIEAALKVGVETSTSSSGEANKEPVIGSKRKGDIEKGNTSPKKIKPGLWIGEGLDDLDSDLDDSDEEVEEQHGDKSGKLSTRVI